MPTTNFPNGLSCHTVPTAAKVIELPVHANNAAALNGATSRDGMMFYDSTAKQLSLFANNAVAVVPTAGASANANNAAAFSATKRVAIRDAAGNLIYVAGSASAW